MKNAKFYATCNAMSWGEGMTLDEAAKNCLKAAGGRKRWAREGFEMMVYELDPAYPVTHIRDYDGHALHIPDESVVDAMGRWPGERHPYKLGDDGKFVPPKRFHFKKGASSEIGRDLAAQ